MSRSAGAWPVGGGRIDSDRVLFVMLGVRRKPAWMAALTALAIAFVLALVAYGMPVRWRSCPRSPARPIGLFPISWIVFSSIMLYRLAVDTGKFEIIKDSVGGLTNDRRLQALFIAFSFGAFIEGAAGFGAPVAVSGAMLAGLGFPPFYAAGICLMANTAPVAFGSIGIPVTTLAGITGLPVLPLSAMVGRLCAMISRHHPDVSRRRDGRVAEDHRGAARRRHLRRLVRRRPVLCLELHGAGADRHPELAQLHRRMVLVLKFWKPRPSSVWKATSRRRHGAARPFGGRGLRRVAARTCCSWSSC